jgi:hypothetical protein
LVRAGHVAEVRIMVLFGPLVERVGGLSGGENSGQAAPATMNDVTLADERKGSLAKPESCCRGEQGERRVAAVGECSYLRPLSVAASAASSASGRATTASESRIQIHPGRGPGREASQEMPWFRPGP